MKCYVKNFVPEAITNLEKTFYATERLIGRTFHDPDIKKDAAVLSYKIFFGDNGDAWVAEKNGGKYSPTVVKLVPSFLEK